MKTKKNRKIFLISSIFIVFLNIFLVQNGLSMFESLSNKQLIASSDLIVVIKVIEKIPVQHGIKNVLYVQEVLKGAYDTNKVLVVKTKDPLIEDIPQFPGPCARALLFLKKSKRGYEVNNFLQGLMPIDEKNQLLGYGLGMNLDYIKTLIKKTGKSGSNTLTPFMDPKDKKVVF